MFTAFPGEEWGEVVWLEWLDWELWVECKGDVVGGPWGSIVSDVGALVAPPPIFVPGILTCTCSLGWTSIRYPSGKKVLKPTINSGWPLNRFETRWMTPGVSML